MEQVDMGPLGYLTLSLVGTGGSILMLPILFYLLRTPIPLATSCAITVVGSMALIVAIHYSDHILSKKAVLFFILPVLEVCAARNVIIPNLLHPLATIQINKALITLLLIFMGITGYCMIKNSSLYAENHLSKNQIIKVVFIVLSLGIIMRILCAGGGFPIILTLLVLMEVTAQETISTSLFIITINSLMGFPTDKHYCIPTGWINLTRYFTLAFLGVLVGLYIAQFINGKRLKKLLDIFLNRGNGHTYKGIYKIRRHLWQLSLKLFSILIQQPLHML